MDDDLGVMHLSASWLLCALLVAPACVDTPPIPDRRILTGSDWIPGRSRTSIVTQGQPIELHNAGPGELIVGSGDDAIVLAPGALHRTEGEPLELHNRGEQEARVQLVHLDASLPDGRGHAVEVRRGDVARTVYTTRGDAPAAADSEGQAQVEPAFQVE